MKKDGFRVGLIVPSSNTTMETEIPKMLNSRLGPEKFTFHSSRMRMKQVTKEELKKMDDDSVRCALELSDAECDVLAYACLVAVMSQGNKHHFSCETRLSNATEDNNFPTPVLSSAGALIEGLKVLDAKKVSLVTPYMKPLTKTVIDYIESFGVEVIDSISLEVADNLEVGRLNPKNLIELSKQLNIKGADVLILSACVQMPSQPVIQKVQDQLGIPVITAASATVYQILKNLNLNTTVPDAGELLSGKY
ncbi:maleate cis-trans isomerase family protein [Salipaludibacillus sp. CF4.18]|uniref:maleate cis-trans isomerase family protein n=1 Tax=Salipaludibacillus sp. CF4.18 TaxID=3373081 RepID=UPI003EE779EA